MAILDRTSLAGALGGLRVPELVMSLRRAAPHWITVLTYHRVGHQDPASTLDDGVIDVSPEQLDRQLEFVRRWFDPIALGDLLAHVRDGAVLPRNPLLITFDDGYRDNVEVALPILQRHGIRATFFVATDYVERRRLFWWDRVADAVKRTPRTRIRLEYPDRMELATGSASARRTAIRRIQRIIKDRRGLDLSRMLGELERATDVHLTPDDERSMADDVVMTWGQVVALRRAGMDVQSHTCTHRVLQNLERDELMHELVASREKLEQVLGEPVRAVSYPVGKALGPSADVRRAVRDAGYVLGFSNGTGVNRASAFDPLDARRISLDAALTDPLFRAMLALPWMAY
jgi:peptidoglycan/xylan/chitin deacetylase (PgdA/CDA1 family)